LEEEEEERERERETFIAPEKIWTLIIQFVYKGKR